MLFLADVCEKSAILKVYYFIIQLIKIACIIIPIGLIIMISIDFVKNVMSNDEEMKKNQKLVIRRIIYCLIIFLIPTIVNLTVSMLNNANINIVINTCISNANLETIKALEAKEKAERKEIEYTPPSAKDKTSNRTISTNNSNTEDSSDSAITTKGAQRILDFAKKRYQKMDKDGDWDWGRSGKHRITCCEFVGKVMEDAGYKKKNSGWLCHNGRTTKPKGLNTLYNDKVDVYYKKSVKNLKPGDVVVYSQSGSSAGSITIFSHKKDGKYYFYGASSSGEVRRKKHPNSAMSNYWKNKGSNLTIIRAK